MFTGIVEELGTVAAIEDQGDAIRLSIHATTVLEDAGLGDSISVNGCCLTITTYDAGTWTADVMQETLDKTSLYGVRPGDRVNLERAVTAEVDPVAGAATSSRATSTAWAPCRAAPRASTGRSWRSRCRPS